jgi:hypothetical protein
MQRIALMSLIVLVLGACGSAVATTADQRVATGPTTAPRPSAVPPTTDPPPANEAAQPATTEPSAAPAIPDDAIDAPDFTLLLGDGTSYTLSEDPKPVYLVFWAEW